MNAFKRQIHFTVSVKRKILIGLILCVYLSFIVIVLQPFDTSQFEAEYKTALLSGYGIFTFLVFVFYSGLENIWYFRKGKVWKVYHEIISILLFCFLSGTVLYWYNRTIVNNGLEYTLGNYFRFLSITVTCMIPVFIPPMYYLRQKFGERIIPTAENSIVIIGENKNEILKLEKYELLFIKAVENYVEICFLGENEKMISLTF